MTAGAELGVVVAYGRLIKPDLLAELDFVNLHFSLLPRWRGAAPVERAILAGDRETGVCLMALEAGLDTGGVYRQLTTGIDPDESADSLRARLVSLGTAMLVDALADGLGQPVPQHGEPTYAAKLDPAEFALAWDRPAVELHRLVRLGLAYTTFRGKRIKVLRSRVATAAETGPVETGPVDGGPVDGGPVDGGPVDAGSIGAGAGRGVLVGTGDGVLELLRVQPEGKAPMDASAWRNGAQPIAGERLGAP